MEVENPARLSGLILVAIGGLSIAFSLLNKPAVPFTAYTMSGGIIIIAGLLKLALQNCFFCE